MSEQPQIYAVRYDVKEFPSGAVWVKTYYSDGHFETHYEITDAEGRILKNHLPIHGFIPSYSTWLDNNGQWQSNQPPGG